MISYDGSVQCTAVTECGRVLRLEVNSLDNIYHKYTQNERAIIDKPIDKPLLENASISPSGCTVAAGITMDSRNNPGNSKDRRIHRVFSATADYRADYAIFEPRKNIGISQLKSIEIGFYSVMKDQDYEPVLNQFIEKYSSDYLPSAFDVIMHLKSVTGDLAKTQE